MLCISLMLLIFRFSVQILLENALFFRQNACPQNRLFCSKFRIYPSLSSSNQKGPLHVFIYWTLIFHCLCFTILCGFSLFVKSSSLPIVGTFFSKLITALISTLPKKKNPLHGLQLSKCIIYSSRPSCELDPRGSII